MPSVMEAATNKAEASNSFSPVTLLKRVLERIHISRGMLVDGRTPHPPRACIESMRSASVNLWKLARESGGDLPGRRRPGLHDSWLLRRRAGLGLLGDDHVFDLVVGGLRDDLFLYQIKFGAVGSAVDDLLRVGVADAGQLLELIFGCSVDV